MQLDPSSANRSMLSSHATYCFAKSGVKWVMAALILLFAWYSASAQSDAKSKELLQVGLKSIGGADISDVVLTATAVFHPGSASDSVPATLRAESSGAIEITYQTAPNPQVETHALSGSRVFAGAWKDRNGTTHPLAGHNMMTEPAWFFPLFAIQRALNGSNHELQVTYVGEETFRGSAAHHLRFIATSSSTPLIQSLAQSELYLDAGTLLPVALLYNDHADNNALLNIPVTILFSNYTSINGILLPAHVQQLRNNAIFVDLTIQNVQSNTHINITPLQ